MWTRSYNKSIFYIGNMHIVKTKIMTIRGRAKM
nr:MAG TPA: hypothetical protein [Caudoviricetes sp.]